MLDLYHVDEIITMIKNGNIKDIDAIRQYNQKHVEVFEKFGANSLEFKTFRKKYHEFIKFLKNRSEI